MITVYGTIGTDPTVVDVTTQAKAQLKHYTREFSAKVEIWTYDTINSTYDDPIWVLQNTMTDDEIISMKLDHAMGNDDMPAIGGTYIGQLDLNLIKTANVPDNFGHSQVRPFIKIVDTINTTPSTIINYDWVQLGVYYSDPSTCVKTDYSYNISCKDAMWVYERYPVTENMVSSSSIGTTLWVTLEDVNDPTNENVFNDYCLISFNTEYNRTLLENTTWKVATPNDITAREWISTMAEMLGCNALIDGTGHIIFKHVSYTVSDAFTADHYITFQKLQDTIPTIDGLKCKKEDDSQSLNAGLNPSCIASFENIQVVTQSHLNEIFSRAFPIFYEGYSCKMQGNPLFEIGDRITITDRNSDITYCFIGHHTLTYNGGLVSEISIKTAKRGTNEVSQNNNNTVGNSITYQVNMATNNIGTMKDLTTTNKGTLVKAINELDGLLKQSTSGKFELPNGLKVCWGSVATANVNGYVRSVTVNFPFTYTTEPMVVMGHHCGNTLLDTQVTMGFDAKSESSVNLKLMHDLGQIASYDSPWVNYIVIGF